MVVSPPTSVRDTGKLRANASSGGPDAERVRLTSSPFLGNIPIKTTDAKTGCYLHAGLEGEYALDPKLALTGRVLFPLGDRVEDVRRAHVHASTRPATSATAT